MRVTLLLLLLASHASVLALAWSVIGASPGHGPAAGLAGQLGAHLDSPLLVGATAAIAGIAVAAVLAPLTRPISKLSFWVDGLRRDRAYDVPVPAIVRRSFAGPLAEALGRLGKQVEREVRSLTRMREHLEHELRSRDQELAERARSESRTRYLAYYDALTDLPNRQLLCERLEQAIAERRDDGEGDESTVSRHGGDEFTILLRRMRSHDDIARVARRVADVLSEPVDLGDKRVTVGASIGIAVHPDHGRSASELLKHADMAMYSAKSTGRSQHESFSHSMRHAAMRRGALEGDLRRALEELRAVGVRVALDDFGTGYSSLVHVRQLPLDVVKLDASFVRGLPFSQECTSIVAAVMGMAHSLDLSVVAEGVERVPQAACLHELGCDEIQGYLISAAQPPSEAEPMLGATFGVNALIGRRAEGGERLAAAAPALREEIWTH